MVSIGNGIIRGAVAGAAGTTALNTASGLDALVRARPSSAPPARPVTLARAAALGAACGARSLSAITALALSSRRGDRGVIASRCGAPAGRVVTALLAAGELVADKLPATPSRLGPPGAIPRTALAAAAAAGMATRDGERPEPAAAVAAVTALSSAALGLRLRTAAARRFGSDLPAALIEDVAAGILAWLGTRRAAIA
jgi:uncharacterized membrane protein